MLLSIDKHWIKEIWDFQNENMISDWLTNQRRLPNVQSGSVDIHQCHFVFLKFIKTHYSALFTFIF